MNRKRIHLIVPDRLAEPLGGMGVGSRHFVEHLSSEFDFDVIGYPEKNDLENYHGAKNMLNGIRHGGLVTLAGQVAYTDASTGLEKPDLVHAYDWSCYLGAWYAAKHFNVPLLVSMRLSVNLLNELGVSFVADPHSVDGSAIQRGLCEMELFVLQQAHHITQVSEAYAKKFEAIDGLKEKTTVVPNGIDLTKWNPRKEIKLPGRAKRKVVYIGRLTSVKGIEALCRATIPTDLDLIFIGSDNGAEQRIFEMMLEKTQREENVHFVGPKYGQDKVDYLAAADAVIMPSLHEPFGIVALEALASKNILISSFIDGMSDFLDEGFAIRTEVSPPGIEEALQQLVNMSETERVERIQKGLSVCKTYSWKSASDTLRGVYNTVISEHKKDDK